MPVLLGPYVCLSCHLYVYLLALHLHFGGGDVKEYIIIVELNLESNLDLLGIIGFTI